MIAAIVLISKPEFRVSILEQMAAQTLEHELVLIEGIQGVSRARNLGFQVAKERGADTFAFIDCDDRYAPWYLAQCEEALKEHVAVGKPAHYVHDTVKDEYWVVGETQFNLPAPFQRVTAPGGTLAGRLTDALPFYEELKHMEDLDWCFAMGDKGKGIFALPPEGYLKQQFASGHTFDRPFEETARGSRRLDSPPAWN